MRATSFFTTMPSAPKLLSSWKSWRVATPAAFHTTQVARGLRDLPDRHVEAVLLEDAGLLREGERREAGPARDADRDLGLLLRERGGGDPEGRRGGDGGERAEAAQRIRA
jgi:hypothetical protein